MDPLEYQGRLEVAPPYSSDTSKMPSIGMGNANFAEGDTDGKGANPSNDSHLRVTLSVGGMTCAACTSAVTDCLAGLDGVTDVAVNLLGKSATMVVEREELANVAAEAVEDCGFEAQVFLTEPVHS